MRLAEQVPDTISRFDSKVLFLLGLPPHFRSIHPGDPYGNVFPKQRVKAGTIKAAGVPVIAGAEGSSLVATSPTPQEKSKNRVRGRLSVGDVEVENLGGKVPLGPTSEFLLGYGRSDVPIDNSIQPDEILGRQALQLVVHNPRCCGEFTALGRGWGTGGGGHR